MEGLSSKVKVFILNAVIGISALLITHYCFGGIGLNETTVLFSTLFGSIGYASVMLFKFML